MIQTAKDCATIRAWYVAAFSLLRGEKNDGAAEVLRRIFVEVLVAMIKENGFTISPDGFPLCFIEIRKNYFPCSNCNVLVAWSQTSVGPKYWIGPGYT